MNLKLLTVIICESSVPMSSNSWRFNHSPGGKSGDASIVSRDVLLKSSSSSTFISSNGVSMLADTFCESSCDALADVDGWSDWLIFSGETVAWGSCSIAVIMAIVERIFNLKEL